MSFQTKMQIDEQSFFNKVLDLAAQHAESPKEDDCVVQDIRQIWYQHKAGVLNHKALLHNHRYTFFEREQPAIVLTADLIEPTKGWVEVKRICEDFFRTVAESSFHSQTFHAYEDAFWVRFLTIYNAVDPARYYHGYIRISGEHYTNIFSNMSSKNKIARFGPAPQSLNDLLVSVQVVDEQELPLK